MIISKIQSRGRWTWQKLSKSNVGEPWCAKKKHVQWRNGCALLDDTVVMSSREER